MARNSLESNTLGIQSDCPHRERLQYGGDIISSSPAALHMFDMSAFYRKVIHDWTDSQFSNGAYPLTSTFMNLLRRTSVGQRGSGETVWASVAPVMAARHVHHYGDMKLAVGTLANHARWLDFLLTYWEEGMLRMYGRSGDHNGTNEGGLGEWLALTRNDSWLTHNAFFLATARAVAYLANKILDLDSHRLENDGVSQSAYLNLLASAVETATQLEYTITKVFKGDTFSYNPGILLKNTAQDLGLHTRIVRGSKRCSVLRHWLHATGDESRSIWPGDEEILFHSLLRKDENASMLSEGLIESDGSKMEAVYKLRYSVVTGIFGMRYTLKTLSDNGFHSLALTKASGSYMPSFGMMLSFNATTLWETYWRSEDAFSRNHPMMGAIAEWLSSSVAGISLSPTTVAGRDLLFWPRIPSTIESASIVHQASATQGTKTGMSAIAWKLLDKWTSVPADKSKNRKIVLRILVPPGSRGELRLPPLSDKTIDSNTAWRIHRPVSFPDLDTAQKAAHAECEERRKRGEGFPFHWHYDRKSNEFYREYKKKSIGTPCESFLFKVQQSTWKRFKKVSPTPKGNSVTLGAGLFEVSLDHWELEEDVPDHGYEGYRGELGHFCSDPTTFDWDINDAEHLI